MEKEEIVLSICISTYNRALRVENMVKHILQNKSMKFNVIVVDDCSTDDTVERIRAISDERVKVYENVTNLGAKLNWHETLEHGDGQYCLHVLDRDWMSNRYIDKVIAILEENPVGFGYIGEYFSSNENEKNKNLLTIYEKGEEALGEFACMLVHPTGFLVRKDCWRSLENRKSFFENDEFGIYPHSYVYALLGNRERAITIRYQMFGIASTSNMGKNLSHFYQKKQGLPYWWTPGAHEREMDAAIRFVSAFLEVSNGIKKKILLNRYKENLAYSTIYYKNTSMNIENARHYGIPVAYIENDELKRINLAFTEQFVDSLKRNFEEICDEEFLKEIDCCAKMNRNLIAGDADLEQTLRGKEKQIVKFKEYYLMMEAWVELYQKGIQLYHILEEQGIRNVAVYGNGKIGKKVRTALHGTAVTVQYIIDRNAERIVEEVPVFPVKQNLPFVDAVIVTIPEQYDAICGELNKVCDYPVISIEDMIYASFEY